MTLLFLKRMFKWLNAIQLFLSKQYFCLLIITSPMTLLFLKRTSAAFIRTSAVFIPKEKQLHKLKVLIFKLLNGNYLFKALQMKHYSRVVVFVFIVEMIIAGMLISKSVFYNKLCWNTCVTFLKFKIYKLTTCMIGYLRGKLLCF